MTPEQAVKDYQRRVARAGGNARAAKLSKARQSEIARKAGIASGKARRKASQKP